MFPFSITKSVHDEQPVDRTSSVWSFSLSNLSLLVRQLVLLSDLVWLRVASIQRMGKKRGVVLYSTVKLRSSCSEIPIWTQLLPTRRGKCSRSVLVF